MPNFSEHARISDAGLPGSSMPVASTAWWPRSASAAIPAIRADFGDAPVITLFYCGPESPSQRVRLETFVQQVRQRWNRLAA